MLSSDESGLYCAAGDFHVDPVKPVARAVFTREDRVMEGCREVIPTEGERREGGVTLTFHPSGFAPGAVQVAIQGATEKWVVTGSMKRSSDPLCEPFEVVRCDALVTEAHFGLPIFRWDDPGEIATWLDRNERAVVFASPVLALRLHAALGQPLRRHESLDALARRYEAKGVRLPASDAGSKHVLAAVEAREAVKERGAVHGLAAGSTRIRGTRRRSNFDQGFAVSEHADWPALLRTIEETGAQRVVLQHGHAEPLARFLREERGLDARVA